MITDVLGALRWCVSLTGKFGSVVFWRTSLIVLLTLVSQVATLLASFLPLKVVILLGSDQMPRYLPEALSVYGRDMLIAGLSMATVAFFVVHLLSERLIAAITVQGSKRLLAQSHKIVLFEKQEEIASNAYLRFSQAVAAGVFSMLAMLGLFLMYQGMAWVLVGYLAVAAVLLWASGRVNSAIREYVESYLQKTMTLVAGIGFFVAFGFLVVDFLLLAPPWVLVAIVSLLLSRQLLGRVAAIATNVNALHSQRVKIDALFFHGKVLLSSQPKQDKTIWPLLEPGRRRGWVDDVFSKFVDNWRGAESIEWHSSSANNVAVLKVVGSSISDVFLIKLFDANRKRFALHEATLFNDPPKMIPGPCLVGTTEVGTYVCLVYRIPGGQLVSLNQRKARRALERLREQLITLNPPEALARRYSRSRPLLWQRLDSVLLERLSVAVVSGTQKQQLRRLLEQLPKVQLHLSSLPLTIVNPDLRPVSIWEAAESNETLVVNWSRWAIEPVGAKWPVGAGVNKKKDQVAHLTEVLEEASKVRPSLGMVPIEAVELSALCSALEDYCLKLQLVEGIELVGRILERLDALSSLKSAEEELPA